MKKLHYVDDYLLAPYHPITINLIGCGGTGSQVLTALARINVALHGLGHIGITVHAYDADVVTEANLGRQLFSENDLGVNKANVLISRLNRFFGTDWESYSEEFPSKDNKTANITITCVDSVKARIEIGKYLRNHNVATDQEREYYWLDFGNTTNTGQVVLGTVAPIDQPKVEDTETVGELKCVDQRFNLTHVKDEDSGPSCSLAEALRKQDLFINSTLANFGCSLLWKLISQGSIESQGMYLNLKTFKCNPINL